MNNKLHVKCTGSGPPLVLLHGWGWNSGIFEPITAELGQYFQLFLVDLPGFGKSPVLTNSYTIEEIAATLFDVVPSEATWLGWSLGGMIAWWVAIHYPHKIHRLITVASSPKFIAEENWPGVSPLTLEKFKQSLLLDYKKTLHDFLDLQLRGSPKNTELMTELQTQIETTPETKKEALLGALELLCTLDLREDLSKLKCPSLHIFGSNDTLVPAEIAHRIQPLLPLGYCDVIKRSGHMPFLSQPDVFLKLILG